MKCPFCQSSSSVLETRSKPNQVWRRHRCTNSHDFSTTQVVENRNIILERRDRQMLDMVLSGATMANTARSFGLTSHSQVSRIVKRMAPRFNARRNGQLARSRKKEQYEQVQHD